MGIIATKWFKDVLDFSERCSSQSLKSEEGKETGGKLRRIIQTLLTPSGQKFKIRHLYMGFGILLVGSVIAVAVFQAEVVLCRWKVHRKLRKHSTDSEMAVTP